MSNHRQLSGQLPLLPAPSGIFGLVSFFVIVFTQGPKLLTDSDTYTHIATGAWMLAHESILRTDIYSHTVPGTPWTAHEWGAQIIMAWLHQTGGLPSVAIAFAAIAALSLTLLYRFMERQGTHPWLTLGLMSVTLLIVFPHMYARPHLFTWLFGILCFDLLHREGRWRWLLPLLMIPWSNLHGGFILGFALQALFLLGRFLESRPENGWRRALIERREDLAILVASIIAASLCNPLGMDVLLFYPTVSSQGVTQFNPEWMAPDLQGFWPFRIYLVALLLLLFCARRRPGWINLLLMVALLDAGLSHRRHIGLAVMFLMPLWTEVWPFRPKTITVDPDRELFLSGWSGPVFLTALVGSLLIALPFLPMTLRDDLARHFPVSKRFPHNAWTWIETHQPQGRVLNEYSWGAYLIYRTEGTVPVFIDGFADKYGEQVYGDYYRMANLEMETDELLDSYRIDWVLFPTDSPLLLYLAATDRWERVYSDHQASVLIRKAPSGE